MVDFINIISVSKNWINFFNVLLKGNYSKKQTGNIFEIFCKLYYLLDTSVKDEYKNVWLFNEIPLDIRKKLNLSSIDHGIDLILEDTDNEYTAIQCKFRSNQNIKLEWTSDSLANLLADSEQCKYKIIFTNASGIDEHTLSKNVSLISLNDLLEISSETFENIYNFISNKNTTTHKSTPRDYQQEIVNQVCARFQGESRGQLILPCGTGKTLTSLWIKESLQSKITLVCLPSLSLLRQTKKEWSLHSNVWQHYLCVCSEQHIDIDKDSIITHEYELGSHVTSSSQDVLDFLKAYSEKGCIIYITYHSLIIVSDAVSSTNIKFDLIIADEAHKTTGIKTSMFGLVHDDTKIPSKFRLYMTATPRVLSKNMKTRLGDQIEYVADMSNPEIFGDVFYQMSFKDAIDKKILVDYKLVVVGVSDKNLQDHIINKKYISEKSTVADYAHNYALLNTMSKYSASHALTFHSTIKKAREFSIRHSNIVEKNAFVEYVTGEQSTNMRAQILNNFKSNKTGVLSNARCLTEGVDVPSIDLVYFCDPKDSKVDIVQATGRALRQAKHKNKLCGYIVVPIFFHDNIDYAIESSNFKNLINIVKALCEQDERLQDEINIGQLSKHSNSENTGHINIDFNNQILSNLIILDGFEDKLRASLFDEIILRSSSSWEIKFNQLKQYVLLQNEYPNSDHELYSWVASQRTQYSKGVLSLDRVNKLNSIHFAWSQVDYNWNIKFLELSGYIEHYSCYPDAESELHLWMVQQRTKCANGKLTGIQIKMLDSINFIWSVNDNRWTENYNSLIEFVKQRNNDNVIFTKWPKQKSKDENEKKLAIWMMVIKSKYKKNELSAEQIELLNKINFPFDPTFTRFNEGIERLIEFIATNLKLPSKEDTQLLTFSNKVINLFNSNKLNSELCTKLKNIGFEQLIDQKLESNDQKILWDNKYVELTNFIAVNRKLPTYSSSNSQQEKAMATWISAQRQRIKKNELPKEQIQELRNLGIDLRLKSEIDNEKWEETYQEVIQFKAQHNNEWPELRSRNKQEHKLANWLMTMKNWYRGNLPRNGNFPNDRYEKLLKIDFDFSESLDLEQLWNDNFDELKQQIQTYGKAPYMINGERNRIYTWLSNQKAFFKKNKLSQQQISAFLNIGIDITDHSLFQKSWMENFKELEKQLIQYDGKIPNTIDGEKNKTYQWLSNQKTKFKQNKLSEEEINLLLSTGINL